MECVQAYTPVNTARTQLEQRQIRFELDLQDNLMTKLPVLQARLKGLANAARNTSCPESVEFWEGRVSEIEFIADTTGKRAALAFAKSFYSGKSGFSTAHLIELNKRAKLCYRATRRRHSSSGSDSSSSSNQHKIKRKRGGKLRTQKYSPFGAKPFQQWMHAGNAHQGRGVLCFKCGDYGHVALNCLTMRKSFGHKSGMHQKSVSQKEPRKCFICEQTSHLAPRCPLNPINTKNEK